MSEAENNNNSSVRVDKLDQDYMGLPLAYFIPVVLISSLLLVIVVAVIVYRCVVSKTRDKSTDVFRDPGQNVVQTVKISHSLPSITPSEESSVFEQKNVLRQTTMPTYPERHQKFQRQLKMDMEFAVCSINHKEQPNLGQIKPELYKQTSTESSLLSVPEVVGTLRFTLFYNVQEQLLVVKVLNAINLPAKDFSGTSDPYVKIYLLPDRKHKFQTKVHRKNLNPVFNEIFCFNVDLPELSTRTLQFAVYDFDRFSRHDLIGQVLVKDLAIHELSKDEKEFSMEILCMCQEKVDLGELLFSLCYLPTAGRLTVTIIKARNLKAMDITGSSDPYVKVALMCQGRRIKKKKTTVRRSTLNPVYNEALVFDIPAENIDECCVVVQVMDYDRVSSNESMGSCSAGLQAMGQGRDHWLEMLEAPRKPVAHWYHLLEHRQGNSSSTRSTPRRISCFNVSNG